MQEWVKDSASSTGVSGGQSSAQFVLDFLIPYSVKRRGTHEEGLC
jgi:hypothetical protein